MKNGKSRIPSPQSPIPLVWSKRAKRSETIVTERWVWVSKCGSYRVVKDHIIYGKGSYADAFFAQYYDADCKMWDNLPRGRHRTKNAAMRHCEQHARERD